MHTEMPCAAALNTKSNRIKCMCNAYVCSVFISRAVYCTSANSRQTHKHTVAPRVTMAPLANLRNIAHFVPKYITMYLPLAMKTRASATKETVDCAMCNVHTSRCDRFCDPVSNLNWLILFRSRCAIACLQNTRTHAPNTPTTTLGVSECSKHISVTFQFAQRIYW